MLSENIGLKTAQFPSFQPLPRKVEEEVGVGSFLKTSMTIGTLKQKCILFQNVLDGGKDVKRQDTEGCLIPPYKGVSVLRTRF